MTDVVLWLHIVAAGTWIGTNVVQALAPSLLAEGGPLVKATWARAVVGFGTRIYVPAAVLLLLTGVELVRSLEYSYGDLFVILGIVTVLVGGALGGVVYGPSGRSLAQAVESGDGSEEKRLNTKLRSIGFLETVLVLFTAFAMVAALGA